MTLSYCLFSRQRPSFLFWIGAVSCEVLRQFMTTTAGCYCKADSSKISSIRFSSLDLNNANWVCTWTTFKTIGVKSNGHWLIKNYAVSKAVYESFPAQKLPSSSKCELAGEPKAFLCGSSQNFMLYWRGWWLQRDAARERQCVNTSGKVEEDKAE